MYPLGKYPLAPSVSVGSADMSGAASPGAVASWMTPIIPRILSLAGWGTRWRLVEAVGLRAPWRLEMLVPVSQSDGEALLSALILDPYRDASGEYPRSMSCPDCAETPEMEEEGEDEEE
jgi:hypothetical protein